MFITHGLQSCATIVTTTTTITTSTISPPTPYHQPTTTTHHPQHPGSQLARSYVPARLVRTETGGTHQQRIPKVIFTSWITRKLGRTFYTQILSLMHQNPEYELVFVNDDDIDRFVCGVYPELARNFSQLR